MKASKPSAKAMWLFRLYRANHHNLDKVLNEQANFEMWKELDNKNRTYVLTGRWS